MNEEYDVIIMGAGFSGVFTAAEVARQGLRVLLLEKSSDIIPTNSSSFNECYKLHTGLHYSGDLKTATHCLENSVYFAKKYQDFLLGADDPNLPWRRGRFYIPADTLVSAEDTKRVAAVLKNKYKSLCKKDPTNKVFGEPEHFLTELTPEQYQEINPALTGHALSGEGNQPAPPKIIAAFETPESQIDLPKIKQHFQDTFAADPNISLKFNTEALHVAPLVDRLGYAVQVKNVNNGAVYTVRAKAVINCTWQNIEYFEQQLGYFVPNDSLIRTKISIRVKLPEALKDIHTSIVATGPFVSITNLGDGTAILTSEKVTNVGYYPAGSHNYHSKPPASKHSSEPLITQLSECLDATPLPDPLRSERLLTAHPAQTLALSSEKIEEKQLHHPDTDKDYRRLLERLLPTYLKLIRNELNIGEGEGKQLADKILEDCSYYVPGLAGSEILDLRVGHVKMPDKKKNYNLDSIHRLQSSIHARQENGAEAKDLCYWSNSGMKMTYVLANAEKLSSELKKHLEIRESIARFVRKLDTEVHKKLRYMENSEQVKWAFLIKPLLYVTYKQILFTEYNKGLTELEEKYLFTKLVDAIVDKIIQLKDIKAYHQDLKSISTPLASTSAPIAPLATSIHLKNPVDANPSHKSAL